MKVIYDISVLGTGFYHQRARTGIARVIENVALRLYGSDELDLQLCAFQSFGQFLQARKYLEQDVVPFGECFYRGSGLTKKLIDMMTDIYQEPSASKHQMRIFLRAFNYTLKYLNFLNPSLDQAVLSRADVFHSTFYPLPERTKGEANLRRFITVYDLIPILYPQYFEFNEDHLIHEVVNSIAPGDWVVAISQSTKDDLCNYKEIDPSRVVVTHLAASDSFYPCSDTERIKAVKEKYRIPPAPYILSLCTLEPRKNIAQTIKSFLSLLQENRLSDLNLVLVGTKGWDFEHIFNEISNAPAFRDRIIVTGYIPDEDLAPLYSGAMMFVYPSFYEGFGLPPLEAMQCGVPVI
ncbi:MAG: glycosyltransferase family 1 protein, partial [Candidatus Schekmanbacteria bacterium]